MTKSPYINKRKWLATRQDEIVELYRSGNDWSQITNHLESVHQMPFTLTRADFLKYCDFLQDEIEYGHFDQNIELKQQLSDLKNQITGLIEQSEAIKKENKRFREIEDAYIEREKELDDLLFGEQERNHNQLQEIREKNEIIKKNEEEKTVLNSNLDQYLIKINEHKTENQQLTELDQRNQSAIKSLKIQRLVLIVVLILGIIQHFLFR